MPCLEKDKIIVVIPAYNEEENITQVIGDVSKYVNDIVIVDDGSQDSTYQKAKFANEQIIVARHKVNLGKGAALKTGCQAALKLGAQTIITMDADGQHSPRDLEKFIAKIRQKEFDIIFGSRRLDRRVPLVRSWGNSLLTKIVGYLSNIYLHDVLSGFRAFSAEAYKKIAWQSSDYSIEVEMIINAGKNKLKYAEIPIATIYKDNYKGLDVLTGIKILLKSFLFRFL